MIQSRVDVRENFDGVHAIIRRRSVEALNAAAAVGQQVAEEKAIRVSSRFRFRRIPAHPTFEGFSAGIKTVNRLTQIFDHGSLGKRDAKLKQPGRRKPNWPVRRKSNPYTATRHDEALTSGGVDPVNITNPARTAGRRALISTLERK